MHKKIFAEALTPGEKLLLRRKRLGFTQVQMSVDLGVGYGHYRAMESDYHNSKAPYITLGPLEDYEVCTILRIREGMSKSELAADIGCSAEWIRQMEQGIAPLKKLSTYWSLPE